MKISKEKAEKERGKVQCGSKYVIVIITILIIEHNDIIIIIIIMICNNNEKQKLCRDQPGRKV